jgi:hypothetical protein
VHAGRPAVPGLGAPVAPDVLAEALGPGLDAVLGAAGGAHRVHPHGPGRLAVDLSGLDDRDRGRTEVVLGTLAAAHGWHLAALEDARAELAPTLSVG